ncbi:uncharacterized protein [Leptinotarsa decemlineata]|uniref:uncharacterized protein n=1 Tax=Leptinotarsa decemlineata TaxID=7539 RepID=UPI003D30B7E9
MKFCLIYLILFVSFYCELVMVVSTRTVCPSISIKNGMVRRRGKGRMVKFICNRTYLLAGERHSTCSHGKWDPSPPKCVRPTCKASPSKQSNDLVLIYPTHNGAVQHFFCKPGYILNGPSDVYCDGSKWDNNVPTCLAVNTKPKLFCDFENEDLCGWTHDLNHDFDWRRENHDTPSGSIGTGPTFDHTKGVGADGYYMYIESSARNENDTARLISPIYDRTDQEVCLEFYYHMFGSTIGSLRVYLKKAKDNWTLDPNLAVFSKSGNQGDKWYRGYQHLGPIDDDFQIIFEGVRGSGYVSDIAIDDVKVIMNCTMDDVFTTQSEIPNTEIIPTVDSCEDRCGQMESVTSDSYHLTCDCDDDCYYKRRCCPDYYDFCDIEATFSYDVTPTGILNVTIMNENIATKTTTEERHFTVNITKSTEITRLPTAIPMFSSPLPIPKQFFTKSTDHFVHLTTAKVTTSKVTSPKVTSPKVTTPKVTTPKVTTPKATTPKVTTPKVKTSTVTTKKVTTPKVMTPKVYRPVIYVKPPPPTTKIIRKVIVKSTTRKPTTPFIMYRPQPTKPRKETDSDVINVPKPTRNDEGLFVTPSRPEYVKPKEYWPDENENSVDSLYPPFFRNNVSESGKLLFTQKEPDSPNTNIFVIVISVTGALVLISVAVFAIVWKYRRPGHRMHFSNGESQSDVRFLTSDEIIDFSLSDCYDE